MRHEFRASSFLVSALWVSVFLTLGGCSKSKDRTGTSPSLTEKQKGVLRVQFNAEPISLDPAEVEDGNGVKLLAQLREGLVGYDAQGKLVPRLAESWKISPDGRRYEFKLKPGLRWSDEQPVRVQDFVYGIRRSLSPAAGGHLGQELNVIRGAREFRAGKSGDKSIGPVSAGATNSVDSKGGSLGVFEENDRLVFELETRAPYFLHALTLPVALPIRRDILEENAGHWSEDKAPGTGPYRFAAYQPGKRFLIEANPYYWGGPPGIGLIDILFVPDESTALNLFESGELDLLTRLPAADVPRLRKKGQLLHTDPYFATYFIAFNTRKAPFNQREFRRAVAGVLHREEITRFLDTGETPARSWIPKGLEGAIPWKDPSSVFADSVKKVRGHVAGEVRASFDSSARNSQIMEKVQQDLSQGLQMKSSLSHMDWKAYVKSLQTDPTPIYRFGWLNSFADPMNALEVFTSSNPNNYTGWSNPEYDRLVLEIGTMDPGPEREAKIRKAQTLLVDDEAAVVPIFHYVQNHLVSTRVKGFKVNPFGVISFHDLTLEDAAR